MGRSAFVTDKSLLIKNFQNPEGHQNPISGSKVTAILLKGWILPIGGASSGEGLHLQPAQQACSTLYGQQESVSHHTFHKEGESLHTVLRSSLRWHF